MTITQLESPRSKGRGRGSSHRRYMGPLLKGPRFEIDIHSAVYPDMLRETDSPPEMLYVIGDISCLAGGLAIVGARKATPYGLSCAERFGRLSAERGIPVVSGGARGCDSAAHRGALDAKGKTVVVLGGGCDEIYPASNAGLFQEVIDGGGAVLSEHPWEFPPVPYAFRLRNRIIAALSRATLIVEAGLPSGTFSTADEALQAGRDVLVVPGAITSANSRGSNRLLFQGALPVVDDESFVELLGTIFAWDIRARENGTCFPQCPDLAQINQELFNDPLIQAILAEPLDGEGVLAVAKEHCGNDNPHAWAWIRLQDALDCGLIAQYPDGRYGAQV